VVVVVVALGVVVKYKRKKQKIEQELPERTSSFALVSGNIYGTIAAVDV
jgi:hypothetical protein